LRSRGRRARPAVLDLEPGELADFLVAEGVVDDISHEGPRSLLREEGDLRGLYPPDVRIAIICDNFSPHLTTKKDGRVGAWATANNVEIAYTPTYSSWLNRIEAQFTALRYFALDGTDHRNHRAQASMIRRHIIWRNQHKPDQRLKRIVDRANVA
jgi:hypothetical protein